jgi:hypothetical protein
MLMPVMYIRIMGVGVLDRLVHVEVGMRFLSSPVGVMPVLVVRIVDMRVFVFQA